MWLPVLYRIGGHCGQFFSFFLIFFLKITIPPMSPCSILHKKKKSEFDLEPLFCKRVFYILYQCQIFRKILFFFLFVGRFQCLFIV